MILPGAYSPAELTATAHGDRGHDDVPSSWLVFVQSAGTLHWRAPWRGKFDPIEGVIIHEEVAELPNAAEEPQRESSSVLVDCRRGSQRMRPSLGRCNKLAAHGSLSPVGPEGIAKYP